MTRGFCATLVAVGCALLLRNVCLAQITFVPGPQRSVPPGPTFAAAARDLDGDGIGDMVVSHTLTAKITVLFGSTDGSFKSAITRQVGRLLRGVTTADFNGDHNLDIAVADVDLSRVFILAGDGAGGLNPTGSFTVARSGPYGIAAGNFDNKNGPDIVTANGNADNISTLFNKGRNSGFDAQPNIAVGKGPRPVGTADFNGDGFDDIVVVDTGFNGTDQLTILLNNGVGSFQQAVPQNFVVGKGARALTIADFNDDGVPDVAVLNGTAIAPNTFSISILINKTILDANNKPVGTGFFNVQQGTQITCPPNINLIPVTCTPRDIASADFDGDGFIDLVVSVSTTASATQASTAGFVTALAGRGDGTFDFATQVLVGLGPRGMAIGDFTGDGSPDIGLTEFTSNTVRILRSVAPPPKPNGETCRLGTQCISGFCVDHVCCGSPQCPDGQVCSLPEHAGQCSDKGSNGDRCTDAEQCQSSFCVDGACCGTQSCGDQFCNTGTCGPPSEPGTPCTSDEQCNTGHCVDLTCCTTVTCPSPQRCDIPGSGGTCTMPSGNGAPCTDPGQCLSGFCTDGVCCGVAACTFPQVCNAPGQAGQCALPPTRTPTSTPTATMTLTATPTITPTPQPTGAMCQDPRQCQSGNCINNTCCSTGPCPTPQRCDIFGSEGVCTLPGGTGQECRKDTDCTTGNCEPSTNTCGAVKTPTPTVTPTPKTPGDSCTSSNQCPEGYTCSSDERVCCNLPVGSTTCPTGESCKVDGSLGNCTLKPTPTPTPTPLIPIGDPCDPNNPDACETGFCVNNVCCDSNSDTCPDPTNRCDISGFEGSCAPPLLEGDECQKNTDCEDPLLCTLDQTSSTGARCLPPPPATPTFPAFTPRPTDVPVQVVTSRGGGCSIGQGPDGAPVWVLGIVPIALWLRRRQLQRVRFAVHRRYE